MTHKHRYSHLGYERNKEGYKLTRLLRVLDGWFGEERVEG
jgi:hypothetical protein